MNKQPKTYIIAEVGVNHNGSLEMAKRLIDVAVEAKADAVKFQTFKSEKEISKFAQKAEYQKKTTDSHESQLVMVKKLELDEGAHQELINYCKERSIEFLSTAFDEDSLELLAYKFRLPLLKIPSGEITNGPLILKFAKTRRPLILSTGMSTLGEIEQALGVIAYGYINHTQEQPSLSAFQEAYYSKHGQEALKKNVTLLHCTTEYPAPFEEVNLQAMDTLKQAFGLPVGLSDHTQGIAVAIAAVARGAEVIEKHITLDQCLPGPDHMASLEPAKLKELIQSIRQVEMALGSAVKIPTPSELQNKLIARKSLVANCDIKEGEIFTVQNLTEKRPGTGISPMRYWENLGKIVRKDYKEDEEI